MSDEREEPPATLVQPSDSTSLRCPACNRTFSRLEHLRRHALVHDKTRGFQCKTCHKSFLRRDTLQRHEVVHRAPLQAKGVRACSACALAKTRCSGGVPCSRCLARERVCTYPNSGSPSFESSPFPREDDPTLLAEQAQTDLIEPPRAEANASQGDFDSTLEETFTGGRLPSWNGQHTPDAPTPLVGSEPRAQRPSQQQSFYGVAGLGTEQCAGHSIGGFDANYWMNGAASTINWLVDDTSMQNLDYNSAIGGSANQYWHDLASFQFDNFAPHQQAFDISPPEQGSVAEPETSAVSSTSPGNTSVTDRPPEVGEFYVDGDAARLPRVKRRKINPVQVTPKAASRSAETFSLAYEWSNIVNNGEVYQTYFSEGHYQSLSSSFNSLCTRASAESPGHGDIVIRNTWIPDHWSESPSVHPSTFTSDFPSKECLDHLVKLYFDNFHSLLPILMLSNPGPMSWQLLLALGALGSHYLPGTSDSFAVSLHEFTRRLLQKMEEFSTMDFRANIEFHQMKLLHCIGSLYCGDARMKDHGLKLRLDLVASHERLVEYGLQPGPEPIESPWMGWKRGELFRRLAYSIWLLDTMAKFHFGQKPTLDSDSTRIQLPSHEQVWAAMTAAEWAELSRRYAPAPTLAEALEQLYLDKKLLSDMGEFSRILLIHGIFRRTWEVEAQLEQPLSHWTPTAEKRSLGETRSRSPVWLPSVSTFARWRNSACDCLDILHWSANATIGLQSGLEHPTVMHLHFARVVLLTPYKNIVRLAEHLSGESRCSSDKSMAADKQMIRRWATLDQYKARLAMIHAGVLFWHVRRFSANGFYEPSSVGLTTLALWAFSAFSDRSKRSDDLDTSGSRRADNPGDERAVNSSEEATCDIILIDRPTDDELVQQFVRRGYSMRANMNGVGDLYGSDAPQKVLIEGRKLLAVSSTWGARDRWLRILDKLATISRQRHFQPQV